MIPVGVSNASPHQSAFIVSRHKGQNKTDLLPYSDTCGTGGADLQSTMQDFDIR